MKNKHNILLAVFLTAETILYCSFMYLDIGGLSGEMSGVLKLMSIFLCFLAAWTRFFMSGRKVSAYIAAALSFTVVSDVFLLMTDIFLPGVISFCVVQSIYLAMLLGMDESVERCSKNARIIIYILLAAGIGAVVGVLMKDAIDGMNGWLIGFGAAYAFSFIRNIVMCAVRAGKRRLEYKEKGLNTVLFLVGLITFLMCDINVLLYNIGDSIPDSLTALRKMIGVAGDFMWMFYLPSQIMIVLSCRINFIHEK